MSNQVEGQNHGEAISRSLPLFMLLLGKKNHGCLCPVLLLHFAQKTCSFLTPPSQGGPTPHTATSIQNAALLGCSSAHACVKEVHFDGGRTYLSNASKQPWLLSAAGTDVVKIRDYQELQKTVDPETSELTSLVMVSNPRLFIPGRKEDLHIATTQFTATRATLSDGKSGVKVRSNLQIIRSRSREGYQCLTVSGPCRAAGSSSRTAHG